MGDVIDFFSRKKIIQGKKKAPVKKTKKNAVKLEKIIQKNATKKEQLTRERNRTNKIVVKNCKVKQPV